MAGSLNKVTLIGNLGQDPEIKTNNSGKRFATFTLATSESWKDKSSGEQKSVTEWHRVVVFSDALAGVIQKYVKKGSKIYIEGQIKTRKWQDKSGQDKYSTEIVLDGFKGQLVMLDSKGEGPGPSNESTMTQGEMNDDIPW